MHFHLNFKQAFDPNLETILKHLHRTIVLFPGVLINRRNHSPKICICYTTIKGRIPVTP